jgi:hypothetical protein
LNKMIEIIFKLFRNEQESKVCVKTFEINK